MNLVISLLLSFTVVIPLIIGLVRLEHIRASYQPFLAYLLLAFTSELVSFLCVKFANSNVISANIYTILEACLILYLFYTWGFLKKRPWLMAILTLLYIGVWTGENIIMGKIDRDFCSYFIMLYSLVTVLLCINEINSLLIEYNRNLFRNAKFLICLGLIIMGVYSLIVEGTLLIDTENGALFTRVYSLFIFINAFVNIVYAIAVYFIPVRDDYYFSKRFKA